MTESPLAFACRSLNLACPPQVDEELMESYLLLDIFSDVRPVLATLPQYKLAILSNGSPRMLSAVAESAGLNGVFTDVISADDVRIYKTGPLVYGLLSQHLGVSDSAVAFASSNFWDVAGAKSFGFWTCWVNRGKLPQEELSVMPDVTLPTLDGLVNVLGYPTARREKCPEV